MAGKARSHLRSRNISPESIRTFALGYAPDYYYGDEADSSASSKKKLKKRSWGEGSLVEYLAGIGFSPDEIVESGLAVRTKKSNSIGKEKMQDRGSQAGVENGEHFTCCLCLLTF